MRRYVRLVPIIELKGQRDMPVFGDIQAKHDLFTIGSVVFVITHGQLDGTRFRILIRPGKGHTGGIVVDPRGLQSVYLNRLVADLC